MASDERGRLSRPRCVFVFGDQRRLIEQLQFANVVSKAELETVPTAQPHWTADDEFLDIVICVLRQEFQSGDELLRQRMQLLEQKVAELTEQLNRM